MKKTAQFFRTPKAHPRTLAPSHLTMGFTMIEALVAIALIGVVSAFGIPGLYGAYQRQQLLNTANEIVTSVSRAKALAQANNQQENAVDGNQPLGPCDQGVDRADYKYIDSYGFSVQQNGYLITPHLRGVGLNCSNTPAPTPISTGSVGRGVQINHASGWGTPLYFSTTTGTLRFAGSADTSAEIELESSGGVLQNVKYYVCITYEKTVVQPDPCPSP